jgi:hypothetical protein
MMQVFTPRARSLRGPKMSTLYSALLFVHLSDSSAKQRHTTYLYLSPAGDVMIAAAPAPA